MSVPAKFTPIEADQHGWWEQPAPQKAVDYILAQPVGTGEGRSQWFWIRLPDGDLVLACYPQGDTYLSTEQYRTI